MEEDIEYITFDGDVLTKSDFRDEIINMYVTANLEGLTKITDFSIGSEAYHISDVVASYVLEHRELIDLNYRMSMIHMAEGEFLDNMGDMRGVHRIGASPSVGEVTLTRLGDDNSVPIVVPDGLQVATIDAISFLIDNDGEDIIIDAGTDSVAVNAICEQEGYYTNVLANTITLVMGDMGNIIGVNNESAFTEGTDIEDDDTYRNRILLSPFNVPTGTLAWYENFSNELESIHDTYVVKGTTVLDPDIIINFNPSDRTDIVTRLDLNDYNEDNSIESTSSGEMTKARADLIELFSMKEYDIVGTKKGFHLAEYKEVLADTGSISYIYGVVLDTGYALAAVKPLIKQKIIDFNNEAMIGIGCNVGVLASIIENEVEGVKICKIVSYDGTDYVELVEPISVGATEVYNIDLTSIEDKIQLINFNMSVSVEE